VNFHLKNPLEGYRRVTFMMLDADVVVVSLAHRRAQRMGPQRPTDVCAALEGLRSAAGAEPGHGVDRAAGSRHGEGPARQRSA